MLADALALADEESAGSADRHRHADRRRARRARAGAAAVLHRRRRAGGRRRAHARRENDPLWRMPLWTPYDAMLDSKIADINNVAVGRLRGLDHLRAVPEALRRRRRRAGCISTSTAGRRARSRARPKAANARPRARSTRCCASAMADERLDPRLTPARPDLAARASGGKVEAARFVDGDRARVSRSRRAGAPTRRRPTRRSDRGADGRARHDLRDRTTKAGPGASSTATAMSAGCRPHACWRPARADASGHGAAHAGVSRRRRSSCRRREALPFGARARGRPRGRSVRRHRDRRLMSRHSISRRSTRTKAISSRSPSVSSARRISGAARPASASTAPAWCRSR